MTTATIPKPIHNTIISEARSKRGSRSIKDWCHDRGYSVAAFYKMEQRGVAPKVIRLPGGAPRISDEADDTWLTFCENLPADIVAEVNAISAERKKRTQGAGSAAVASPLHPKTHGRVAKQKVSA